MTPLVQQQPPVADHSILSQRLDMPQVDLPPEESSVNLTQLVPELDLLGEKSKDKKDDSEEEEVKIWNAVFSHYKWNLIFTHEYAIAELPSKTKK